MTSLSEALNGMTEKERVVFWLENGHRVDVMIALYDLGVHYDRFDKIIKELVEAELPLLYEKKTINSNYGGAIVVESYQLKQ